MAIEAPQPVDEAFEERLAWSPPREDRPRTGILAPAPVAPHQPPAPTPSAGLDAPGTDEMQRVRETLVALREDIVGLRHAVLEWPDLEQIAVDMAEVRTSIQELGDRPGHPSPDAGLVRSIVGEVPDVRPELGDVAASLAELRRELASLRSDIGGIRDTIDERPAVGAMAPVIEELASIQGELVQLKRRISLRAKDQPAVLDDDTIDRIAEAVIARLPTKGRSR